MCRIFLPGRSSLSTWTIWFLWETMGWLENGNQSKVYPRSQECSRIVKFNLLQETNYNFTNCWGNLGIKITTWMGLKGSGKMRWDEKKYFSYLRDSLNVLSGKAVWKVDEQYTYCTCLYVHVKFELKDDSQYNNIFEFIRSLFPQIIHTFELFSFICLIQWSFCFVILYSGIHLILHQ